MSAFSDLRKKLAELFQLDAAAELDFGIYRILNARRVEIEGFLDSLEPQVEAILAEALQTGTGELIAELEKVEAGLRAGGFDDAMISTALKVKELREKIASAGGDPTAITHEIFSLLTTFFGRYYKDGDFLSLRRYKKDTYAIPYEGEEVKLHWANADQYYIKSAETYRDYSFKLGPAPKDDKPDTRPTVTFKLTEADAEKDNNKAVAGQERRFVYQGQKEGEGGVGVSPASLNDPNHLILNFAHLPIGKAEKQAALNEAAAAKILAEHAKGPFTGLAANDPTYTVKSKTRSILAKHLTEYTGKNSFDYFIHKDLGGFLRRELDFFIKNEVLHLDDLDDAPEANWKETRAKIKALRTISGKVIRFLAQIENFQKKLWLKKKFVTACDYVVTLDRIPEELYPEIAACDAQRDEWVRLFAIDEIKGDLGRVGYSVPLSVEFLKGNPRLLLATQWFGQNFNFRLNQILTRISGMVVYSENYQGLRFCKSRYGNGIGCIYVDPPYNTGSDDFIYKDTFWHSSWATMMLDRLEISKCFLADEGSMFTQIDDYEEHNLRHLLDMSFSAERRINRIAWVRTFNSGSSKGLSKKLPANLDTIFWYSKAENYQHNKILREYSDGAKKRYDKVDESGRRFKWNPMKTYSEKKLERLIASGDAQWTENSKYPVYKKYLDEDSGAPLDNHWHDIAPIGTFASEREGFATQKPVKLIERCVSLTGATTVLDFFAGSGTTGHAVINLNREDGGDRKYNLIEMGEHFDTVLVPRLKKVIYSKDWKDGRPQNRNTGISHCFKILRLESYEDTLNNLRLHRTREQELALEKFSPEAREDYQLGYMLDLEASGSQSLLNISAFTDPFNYTLQIATGTAGETKSTQVDLVETFNWLLGLTVLAQGQGGGVTWVEGTNPEGEKVLVLWRNTTAVDAEALNAWCKKQKISVLDGEFAVIYVNGDHHLENLRRDDQTWKVRLTDEEFPKLMWEGCE